MNASPRPPAVAGLFYPADPSQLAAGVDAFLAAAAYDGPPPKALIVPHAGYDYSGPVAGSGYASLRESAGTIEQVLLLGPAHRVPLDGLAVPSTQAFLTPLGPVGVDAAGRDRALALPGVVVDDGAHAPEHSLEVHLPFLQRVLGPAAPSAVTLDADGRADGDGWLVLPLVVGRADPDTVAAVVEALWGGPETLIVVSSDLSHYEDHAAATAHDRRTAAAIVAADADAVGAYDACGAEAVRGLLLAARARGLTVRLLDLRNSGDTAGGRDRVVGYGAFALLAAA